MKKTENTPKLEKTNPTSFQPLLASVKKIHTAEGWLRLRKKELLTKKI